MANQFPLGRDLEHLFRCETFQEHVEVALLPGLEQLSWDKIDEAGNQLISYIAQAPKPLLLVDLSNLEYMGSAMVALVARFWKSVKEKGKMAVVNKSSMVEEVLRIAGLTNVWKIVDNRDDALKELGVSVKARKMAAPPMAGSPETSVPSPTPVAAASPVAAGNTGQILAVVCGAFLALIAAAGAYFAVNPGPQIPMMAAFGGMCFAGGIAVILGGVALFKPGSGGLRAAGAVVAVATLGVLGWAMSAVKF